MQHFKFLDKYSRKIIAPTGADYNVINVIPYFYSQFVKGTSCVHTHDFWELTFVIKGSLDHYINNKKYRVQENTVLLIKPQDVHHVDSSIDWKAEYYNFVLRESFVKELLDGINKSLYEEILNGDNICIKFDEIFSQQICNLLSYLYVLDEKEYKLKQKHLEIIIARIFSEFLTKNIRQNFKNGLVAEILNYMRNMENMENTLEDLSYHFGYCTEHISRLFKKSGLDTPSKEWKKIKLSYASSLLEETNYTILRISQMMGISNVNYFSKIFKDFFGMTPGKYRKNIEK